MKKLSILAVGLMGASAAPVAAEAAEAQVVDVLSVSRTITVTANGPRSLTLGCPGTSVALSGAVTTGLDTLTDSIPRRGVKYWTFRFSSPSGSREVNGVLRCVRLEVPAGVRGVSLVVGSAIEPGVRVGAGRTKRVAVRCPRGQVPTGWGFKRVRGARSIAVAVAAPSRAGWVFKFENRGNAAALVAARIRCLAHTQHAGTGQTHSFSLRAASYLDRVDAGNNQTARHRCRADEFSLSTGLSLDPDDDILLRSTHPTGERGGLWSFRRPSGSSTLQTTLLCLARDTRFR